MNNENVTERVKMKNGGRPRWKRPMTVTALLIILAFTVSAAVTGTIKQMEEEKAFERLHEEAGNIAEDISESVADDREQIEVLASAASGYEDLSSQELWDMLNAFDSVGMISRIEILLPGDVVLKDGKSITAEGLLSFEKEEAKGTHVSDRERDLENREAYVVRSYVPIVRGAETVAMMYGVIELENLPEKVTAAPYGGDAAIYIIDGNSGDFLVDTWHNDPGGNIWELGKRQMAPGYDHESLKQGVTDGSEGYVVFASETIGENLYFYYEPIAVNEWRIALSVPEHIVFENADKISVILNGFLCFEALAFLFYFFWMIHYVRRETNEKQRQLDMIQYIYEVEKLLFSAHEKEENLLRALEKIGGITGAQRVVFSISGLPYAEKSYIWRREEKNGDKKNAAEQSRAAYKEERDSLYGYFENGNESFEAYSPEEIRGMFPGLAVPGIKNIIAIPVKEMDGRICALLAVFNTTKRHPDIALLKSVEFSFGMFFHNFSTYSTIREQGEKDVLTGLYNRNRYEADIPGLGRGFWKSLICIYMDADGLHELNNARGHEAGDRMLKSVAEQLKSRFGTKYSYRVGGDEFVVFVPEQEEKSVLRLCGEMAELLEKEGYHISYGAEYRKDVSSMGDMIKSAEKKMYKMKREYYEQGPHDRRKRPGRY